MVKKPNLLERKIFLCNQHLSVLSNKATSSYKLAERRIKKEKGIKKSTLFESDASSLCASNPPALVSWTLIEGEWLITGLLQLNTVQQSANSPSGQPPLFRLMDPSAIRSSTFNVLPLGEKHLLMALEQSLPWGQKTHTIRQKYTLCGFGTLIHWVETQAA